MDKEETINPVLDVIIPVYNEEPNIPMLLGRIKGMLKQIEDVRVEVIFIDDHSMDNSPALLKDACRKNKGYRYLRLSRNSGSHISILAGLDHVQGDSAVFMASDLPDPPALIPQMLELWRTGKHIVWAVRAHREGISWIEKFLA